MTASLHAYPDYKDSGLPWLPTIPAHWAIARAKLLFKCIDMRSLTGDEELLTVSASDGVVPRREKTVTMFMAQSYEGHKLCWPRDLVINSLWAWAQGLGFSRHHGIVSSAYGVYRLREEFSDHWTYFDYLLRSSAYDWELRVRSKGVWTSRLQLTDEAFLGMPLLIPPADEAEAIVSYLSLVGRHINRVVRAKRRLIELLNEQKQAIIHRTVTRGLDLSVPLKPSGAEWLGCIPEHWEVKRLHQITDPSRPVMYGIVLPGPNVDDGVYIVKGGDCEPGRLRPERLSRTTREIESRYARSRLAEGDVVFAIRGGVGAAELVPRELAGANVTQDAARIASGSGIHAQWLLHAVRSPMFQVHVKSRVVGATVRGVNIRDLERVEVVIPPHDEQMRIAHDLDDATRSITDAVDGTLREIAVCREYHVRLISDIVTGRLDVRGAKLPVLDEGDLLEGVDTLADQGDDETADAEEAGDADE